MTMKKVIALALSVAMLCAALAMLVACGEDEPAKTTAAPAGTTAAPSGSTAAPTTTGTPVVTTTVAKIEYVVPEVDLEGDSVTFVIADTDSDMFNNRSIFPDEDNGDPVDTVIAERNEKVEEAFNCELAIYEEYTGDYSVNSKYGALLLSNTDEIDIIAGRQWDDMQLATKGYMQDLSQLKDYINYDAPYWASDYIDGMNYMDKVYWLTGDLNLRYTGGFYTVFVNKTLYNMSCAATYGEDLYKVVYDGDWHYDTVQKMAQLGWQDIGEKQDVTDAADVVGLALTLWDNTNAMTVSAGIPFGSENADGSITMNIVNTNERLSTFVTTIDALTKAPGVLIGQSYTEFLAMLASDQAMMVFGRLNQAELHLRDMESDYFILPYPKLDDTQERYYSSVHDGISIFGINAASDIVEESAAVLEYLAYLSYKDVRAEYYEYALKYRYTRDDGAAEMIDYIASVATSDIVYVWCFSDDFGKVYSLGSLFRTYLKSSSALKSTINKANKSWKNAANNIQTNFEELWANEG